MPQWLQYQFPVAICINKYRVVASRGNTLYAPKNWTFSGSNDGSIWEVLDTRSNIAAFDTTFSFISTESFIYYRLTITAAINSANKTVIQELYMYESGYLYGWQDILPSEMGTKGMPLSWVNALTTSELSEIFQPTQLDIASYFSASDQGYINSISVTLPPNHPPVITNPQITLTTHNDDVTLTAHIKDAEGDDAYYRVLINGEVYLGYTTNGPEYNITQVIPASNFVIGTNAIEIESYDGDKTSNYTTYVTRINGNPAITGILTGDYLNATVGDPEGDLIKYRILVNGEVRRDWTEFMEAPTAIEYRISTQDVIFNAQNNIAIEAQDNMGGIGNCVFDFVGQYYNIMFMDEYGDYYSDDKGQMLKALDLGSFLIRQSSEVKPVIIKNTTGILLKDIVISSDPNENTIIELSLTKEEFDKLNSITLPVMLGNGDTYTIYIKARADKEQAIGKNALKLYVAATCIKKQHLF